MGLIPDKLRRLSVQPTVVRLYKLLGFAALSAILIGLIAFLTVNAFYMFNRTWIRPVILTPTHERVLQSHDSLTRAQRAHDDLVNERAELEAELVNIGAMIEINSKFETEFAAALRPGAHDPEALIARRELDRSVLERREGEKRREVIAKKIKSLDQSIERFARLVSQIEESPYIAATMRKIVVAFVPYENLGNVRKGSSLYACHLGLVACSQVGFVVAPLEGEVSNSHPHSGDTRRGVFVEISLTSDWAAEENVLFAGGRPLWLF